LALGVVGVSTGGDAAVLDAVVPVPAGGGRVGVSTGRSATVGRRLAALGRARLLDASLLLALLLLQVVWCELDLADLHEYRVDIDRTATSERTCWKH
jgi:hypothetical protein